MKKKIFFIVIGIPYFYTMHIKCIMYYFFTPTIKTNLFVLMWKVCISSHS